MDNFSGRVAQGQGVAGDTSAMPDTDWRTQLQADARGRIVNKILETLKRHIPFAGQEGLQELKIIAIRFEEKIFTSATSQQDYLRSISLRMLTMEAKSLNPMANSNTTCSKNPPDIVCQGMDNFSWRAAQGHGVAGDNSAMPDADWRAQLQADTRGRIVNKILETLKRRIPFSGLQELKIIAIKFEEKVFNAATSQHDYLRRISLKMLTMEAQSLNPMANSNTTSSKNPPDTDEALSGDEIDDCEVWVRRELMKLSLS